MAKYSFYATESVSGDVIQGYVYDSTGSYSVGWEQTLGTDEDGGKWTYHVYQKDAAGARRRKHRNRAEFPDQLINTEGESNDIGSRNKLQQLYLQRQPVNDRGWQWID